MLRQTRALLIGLALSALVGHALADPCQAVPDHGLAPAWLAHGARFSGPVVYIGDGDSLCVAVGPSESQWVEVRIADFYAPELREHGGAQAKAMLARIAQGRNVSCLADHQTYDRIAATCWIQGRSIGDLMRSSGVAEGGRGH